MVRSRRFRFSGRLVVMALGAFMPAAATLAQVSGEVLVGRVDEALSSRNDVATAVDFTEPHALVLPQPVYPRAARAARQEGRVMVCFMLDERGMVHTPVVRSSTDEVFDQPVLDALRGARFEPARAGGKPVRSTVCRTFRFVLR